MSRRSKVLSAAEAVALVPDGATLATSGFVGTGHPEELTKALGERFRRDGAPRGLTLVYAAGQGDGKTRGVNHLGQKGLLRRVIGGHWNLAPEVGRLVLAGEVEAYNFPQGVISKIFREIASGNPALLSKIGLGTFIDPRLGGGKMNARTTEDLVRVVEMFGEEVLAYKTLPIDVAFIRATSSDSEGNLSFEREALTGESLSMAQAARNSGGLVIAQVESMVDDIGRDPKAIRVPGIFVDVVVVSSPANHMQTFAEAYNPCYCVQGDLRDAPPPLLEAGPRRIIAARSIEELRGGEIANLGIGIAEGVAMLAFERNRFDEFVLTVEAGVIGGIPAAGLSFGASLYPRAMIDQPNMFDFYDGGGLDIAFLSMAEVDARGNVNVSKYGGRVSGTGGFVNIAQTAKRVVFLSTFTAGNLETRFEDGALRILREGAKRKFVQEVEQITFSAEQARASRREILYITERAVFRLVAGGIELVEVAPGIDVHREVLGQMDFAPSISPDLKIMHADVFTS